MFHSPMPEALASPVPSTAASPAPAPGPMADGRSQSRPIDVSVEDARVMMLYLGKARDRAARIWENAPAGTYLESVLRRTVDNLESELAQLTYLLGCRHGAEGLAPPKKRMRPAI